MMLLMVLAVTALTGWGALALYFGDSHSGPVQTALAGAFGLAGIATILGMLSPRWRGRLVGAFLVLFVAVLA